MDKIIFRWLLRLWAYRAKKQYGGPGEHGELFNTACFQYEVGLATGFAVSGETVFVWLTGVGYFAGPGGCHWFDCSVKANANRPRNPMCDKQGCSNKAIYTGVVGNLNCYSCETHIDDAEFQVADRIVKIS